METISAADANRHFSRLLRRAQAGVTTTILSRGKPVATIAPFVADAATQETALQRLLERLQSQKTDGKVRTWTRDELYER